MKKKLLMLIVTSLFSVFFLGNDVTVEADLDVGGCYPMIVCVGPMHVSPTMYHLVIDAQGNESLCSLVQMTGYHEKRCAGCYRLLGSSSRVCVEYHSICGTRSGLCQNP